MPDILEVDRPNDAHAANPPTNAPSDARIAYFLARFVKNTRSLSVDPVAVRANWMDALNYVTDRGAQTLNDHAGDTNPFMKLGLCPLRSK